jgi:excisionase family DNA binding protein
MESMMTARQVAELLGVHENWVYDQAVAGDLPSYKLGGSRRFDPEELRGWIAAHREVERRPGPQLRRARRASSATEAYTSASRRDDRVVEPERPKLPSCGRSEDVSDSGEAQARLFEA